MDVSGPITSGMSTSTSTNMKRQRRTRVSLNGREGRRLAGVLDVLEGLAGGKVCNLGRGGLRDGDDLRAVVELAHVVAEHGHLRHRLGEPLDHELLVVWRRRGQRGVACEIRSWYSLTNDCHSQAVRGSLLAKSMSITGTRRTTGGWEVAYRESTKSDWRRTSPGRGDRTSPGWEPLPGNATPLRRVYSEA